MIAWIQSWSRRTWLMAWGMLIITIGALVFLFGPETITRWIEGLWSSR